MSCLFGGKFTTTAHGLFRSGRSHASREGLVAGSYESSSICFCAPGACVVGASGANVGERVVGERVEERVVGERVGVGVAGANERSCRAAADGCVLPSDVNASSLVGCSSDGGVGAVG